MTSRSRVSVEPDVLRWARVSSGTTVLEAAARIGQRPEVLTAWEAGQERPTLGALGELATYYERPLEAFLLPRPPDEPKRPPDLRAGARHEDHWLGRGSSLAIRRARRIQTAIRTVRTYARWVNAAGDTGDPFVAAKRVRAALDVTADQQSGWPNVGFAFAQWRLRIEATGVPVLQADMPLDEVRAFSVAGDPPVISINEHDYVASKVFSLFHEYGHLVLGNGGICTPLKGTPARELGAVERSADLFAGAVLVPTSHLRDHQLIAGLGDRVASISASDLSGLAATFRVSTQVIWYRLRQSELIDQPTFSARWDELRHPVPTRRIGSRPMVSRAERARRRLGRRTASELLAGEERGQLSIGSVLADADLHIEDLDRLAAAVH